MKKFLCLFFVVLCLLTSLMGCESNKQKNNTTTSEESKIEISFSESEAENNVESDDVIERNDNIALFLAMDRHDVEGDRNKFYFYNHKGDLLDTTDDPISDFYPQIGLIPALDPATRKVGFVDKDGVFQIEPIYDDASYFSKDGIALVMKEVKSEYTSKQYGYINSKGEEIIPCIYNGATSFFDFGYAVTQIWDELDGTIRGITEYILDKNGNAVVKFLPEDNVKIVGLFKDYYLIISNESRLISFDYSNTKISETILNIAKDVYSDGGLCDYLTLGKDCVYITTKNIIIEGNNTKQEVVGIKKLLGKNLVEEKNSYEITSKRVSTTSSGIGYGIIQGEKTVVPFKYDNIIENNGFFIATVKTANTECIDIYDSNYNLTAENIPYSFYNHISSYNNEYGRNCSLPSGYFRIYTTDRDGMAHGIIDYAGNVIVEPVFDDFIIFLEYRGLGNFNLL